MKKRYNPNIKQPNQNLFDFVLMNYGSLDGLSSFLQNQASILEFENAPVGTVFNIPTVAVNSNRSFIQGNSLTISTGSTNDFVKGDYNNDYNKDFLI